MIYMLVGARVYRLDLDWTLLYEYLRLYVRGAFLIVVSV